MEGYRFHPEPDTDTGRDVAVALPALPEDQIVSENQGNLLRSTFCAPPSNGIFISKKFTVRNLDKCIHGDFSPLLPLTLIS